MKLKKYILLAITGSIFYSCDVDEFLNPLPETAVVVDTYFQSDADVLTGIIGIYDAIQGVNENTDGDDVTVNRGIQYEYLLTEHRSDNTRSATLEGSRADFHRYLTNADNEQSEDYWASMYDVIFRANNILNFMDVADAGNVAKYSAEAKFLRAYAYFNLVRLYGDVPLITEVLIQDDKEALFTRVDVSTVYAQIVADLTEAVAALDNTNKARASKAAAQGLLAKVYMSQPSPDYAQAKTLCEAVISDGSYSLEPNFNDVFYSELNNEIIFAIQYLPTNPFESQGFSAEFTSAVRKGLQDGLNMPNENLILDLNAFGGSRTATSITNVQGSIEVAKFLPDGNDWIADYGPNPRNAGNDWIILRYSDILLMHVEAIMASSSSTSNSAALASFQLVRNRAGLTTSVTSISKNELLRERRVEFAFENQRFFDLLRFGVADQVLSDHAADMGYTDYSARALLLPIPAREINLSSGLLTQNP
ncbi:RagB/SusD family nutrient uptake outer membrane protein [Reichenbachiella carrageenanivorans]|uniref:RagB/SusD family nutrient uptake outer membrane protein n=1 Tax=Reichenbachiella carrageenanivorans TaxID=2979869 RepID=A0ABY6CWH7_9BACT|nr:RagB/SusD family nutrient uptake outer membrane protein [Reichenbachiella carrageenanivorans]UXX78262.1 RagB/SusD family nutrient uptake outer membrane protein [Reichenbachiella carrageenanivorans]